jgi:outer membrane lipopolysaccharide assembly protein LptE/RlpB
MIKKGPVRKTLFILPVAFLLFSCGYQLIREKGIYGGDISCVYISIFKNQTHEPHISQYVTDAFSKELLTTGLFTVNKEGSEGFLQGTIVNIKTGPHSMNISGVTIEKVVTLWADMALYRKNGVFVKRWSLSESEIYRVDNIDYEEYNKTDAVKRAAARMARRFTSLLLVEY